MVSTDCRTRLGHLDRVAHVERQRNRLLSEMAGKLVQSVPDDVDHDDPQAVFGKPPHRRETEGTCGAGHESEFACE